MKGVGRNIYLFFVAFGKRHGILAAKCFCLKKKRANDVFAGLVCWKFFKRDGSKTAAKYLAEQDKVLKAGG